MSKTISLARERAQHYASRNSAYSKVTDAHLGKLAAILKVPSPSQGRAGRILTGEEEKRPFNSDWTGQIEGVTPAVLQPTCVEHVSEILKYCQAEKLAVVPQGGNTGLVYGGEPVHDELVLSTVLFNAPPKISVDTMSVEAEAGVILQKCQEACEEKGLLFPMTMGSRGSAFIGGCVSTNAGGIHYARYGSMHANVLGVEVVTPTGEILNLMSTLRKDNAGYDLKHLYIGSEGTLGVVTRAAIKLTALPKSKQLAFFRIRDFQTVLAMYQLALQDLAECLSAFEVMDAETLIPVPAGDQPYPHSLNNEAFKKGSNYHSAYFSVMVETNGSVADHDFDKLSRFIENMQEKFGDQLEGANEPVLTQSEAQAQQLWRLREDVAVMLANDGLIYKFDVSFPLHQFYDIVEFTRELIYKKHNVNPDEVYVVGYGHFGDGNVHLNVVDRTRKHQELLDHALYPAVYEFCASHGGSISAEHGVGMQKREYLHLSRPQGAINFMRDIKRLVDPNNILNPYKVLPIGEGGH